MALSGGAFCAAHFLTSFVWAMNVRGNVRDESGRTPRASIMAADASLSFAAPSLSMQIFEMTSIRDMGREELIEAKRGVCFIHSSAMRVVSASASFFFLNPGPESNETAGRLGCRCCPKEIEEEKVESAWLVKTASGVLHFAFWQSMTMSDFEFDPLESISDVLSKCQNLRTKHKGCQRTPFS